MAQIGSNSNMNVIIETGGANAVGWTTVKRTKILKEDDHQLSDLGSVNMGNPDTLRDFIEWGVASYPADKYHLILWDHGGGVDGFGQDEMYGGDLLTLPELNQALSQAKAQTGATFEVLGFDACLMATIEVATLASHYAKFLVASEELEPGHGWDYAALLSSLKNNTALTGSALGKVIADSYKAQATAYNANEAQNITLSVVELAKLAPVASAWNSLMAVATPRSYEEYVAFGEAAADAMRFGKAQRDGDKDSAMVDLADVAGKFSVDHSTEASAVINAVNQAVVYKVAGTLQTGAKGLSVKFPRTTAELSAYLAANAISSYSDALEEYILYLEQDTTPPAFSNEAINWTTEKYSADVSGNDVAGVYATVWVYDDQGAPYLLGMDTTSGINGSTFSYSLPKYWLTLEGQFVSSFTLAKNGSLYLLDIPVLLNGVDVEIMVYLDTGTMTYYLMGAWPGYADDGMAERVMLPLNDGDVITPYFMTVNGTSGDLEYVLGSSFSISGGPTLNIAPLPKGNYGVAFYAEDFAGNAALSDMIAGQYSLARMGLNANHSPDAQLLKEKALEFIASKRGAKVR